MIIFLFQLWCFHISYILNSYYFALRPTSLSHTLSPSHSVDTLFGCKRQQQHNLKISFLSLIFYTRNKNYDLSMVEFEDFPHDWVTGNVQETSQSVTRHGKIFLRMSFRKFASFDVCDLPVNLSSFKKRWGSM